LNALFALKNSFNESSEEENIVVKLAVNKNKLEYLNMSVSSATILYWKNDTVGGENIIALLVSISSSARN